MLSLRGGTKEGRRTIYLEGDNGGVYFVYVVGSMTNHELDMSNPTSVDIIYPKMT